MKKAALGVALLALAFLPAAGAQTVDAIENADAGEGGAIVTRAPALRTVSVDCSRGKSIMRALDTKAAELIIEISGICTEDVLIRRDHVTLRGTDPTTDGIQAVTTDEFFGGTVTVREGRHVRFENLSFLGNTEGTGLRIENSQREVSADHCIFTGNRLGAVAVGGLIEISNSSASGNTRSGLAVGDAGRMTCTNCQILDNFDAPNSGVAAFVTVSGVLSIIDSTITNSNIGLLVSESASLFLDGSTMTGTRFGVTAFGGSSAEIFDSTVEGAVFVEDQSRAILAGVTQPANVIGLHLVSADSFLSVRDTPDSGASTLAGDLLLDSFSNARLFAGTTVGAVQCDASAEAFCDPTVVKTSSTCGLCP